MNLTSHQMIQLRRAGIEVTKQAFVAHTPAGDVEYTTAYWPQVHRFVTARQPEAEGAILKADADLRRILGLSIITHQWPEPWNRPELWERPAAELGPIS